MVTFDADRLVQEYPQLFHMAEYGTWPKIRKFGLLSTTAILDRTRLTGKARHDIEACHRPECVVVQCDGIGEVVIRDQKPMSDGALSKCLDGLKPADWYRSLNRRVFFWLTRDRLMGLLKARAYRKKSHCVLIIDTAGIVGKYHKSIELCPINSGSTAYRPVRRGRETFNSIEKYPFNDRRRRRGRANAVVELTVSHSVPDVAEFTTSVMHMQGENVLETLYPKG